MKAVRAMFGGMWGYLSNNGKGTTNIIEDADKFDDGDFKAEEIAASLHGFTVPIPHLEPKKEASNKK